MDQASFRSQKGVRDETPLSGRPAERAAGASSLAAEPVKAPMRRLALVVGANRGAADRVPLRYAVADAERFAEVVTRMGGVQAEDRIVLRDPTRQALVDALAETAVRVGGARAEAERVEVIVYFSGHADDKGLMLGREMLSYRGAARRRSTAVGADVGITILDACASGAITRLKGGRSLIRLPDRRVERDAGLRVPHLQLRERGRPGVGAAARLVLHPRAAHRPARRRRRLRRRQGHAERGLPVRLPRDPGRRPTATQAGAQHPGLRHQDGGHGGRGDDGRAPELVQPRPGRRLRRALRRARAQAPAGGGAVQARGTQGRAGPGARGVRRLLRAGDAAPARLRCIWPRANARSWCGRP